MNFVFVSYNYSPGFKTPDDWIKRIRAYTGSLEYLSKNHKVNRIEQIDYKGSYQSNGVNYHFTDLGRGRRYFPFKLNSLVKSLNPDVVVIHGTHYPLPVILLSLILKNRVPILVQHHAEKPFTGIKKYLQRVASLRIDAFLFASRELGLYWVKKGNIASREKIQEIMEVSSVFHPMTRDLALAKTNAKGNPIFLWVGRLNANKDPLNVINAFLTYCSRSGTAKLYMIYHTDDLLDDINTTLYDHPYGSSIILIGKVPNDDLLYWYNSADFIISGSHYEGSGTAICEALSCGCIPIVTNIESFRMITNHGQCGVLYEPGDKESLVNALILAEKFEIAKKRGSCINHFEHNLSFQAISKKIVTIAAELI